VLIESDIVCVLEVEAAAVVELLVESDVIGLLKDFKVEAVAVTELLVGSDVVSMLEVEAARVTEILVE